MYPAHTQLVAKCSSPSIGDQRATGCAFSRLSIEGKRVDDILLLLGRIYLRWLVVTMNNEMLRCL